MGQQISFSLEKYCFLKECTQMYKLKQTATNNLLL